MYVRSTEYVFTNVSNFILRNNTGNFNFSDDDFSDEDEIAERKLCTNLEIFRSTELDRTVTKVFVKPWT
jgi:hypothetical protein